MFAEDLLIFTRLLNKDSKAMSSEFCHLAAEGWYIISRYSESREAARKLLRLIAETLEVGVAEIRFEDGKTSYRWNERVERIPPGRKSIVSDDSWSHPFPSGGSFWHFEGFNGDRDALGPLLDLLADQWLRLTDTRKSTKAEHQIQNEDTGTSKVNPAWTAVSRPARLIKNRLRQLSYSLHPLLILGEVGTGKSHLASLIHNSGPAPTLPFTGAEASALTGTLFVSNWWNLEERQRRILLNDPRHLIAASDKDTGLEMIRQSWAQETGGKGSVLTIPPLRERKADLPMLAGRFIELFVADSGFPLPDLSQMALEALKAYPWPGNIRELKESISWALERCDATRIEVQDLPPAVRGALQKQPNPFFPARLVALEYKVLREELMRQNGNMTRTAKVLGLTPRQISWRVRKYSINLAAFKSQQRAGA